jgi:hypothetical protein
MMRMDQATDRELLREYVERRSEPAFSALARRHVDLVYSAALRMVRNPQTAEEFIQMAEASNDPNKIQYIQEILARQYGVEDAILMPLMALNEKRVFTAYRILSEESESADERVLQVETQFASTPAESEIVKLRRINNEWKFVVDDAFVKSIR